MTDARQSAAQARMLLRSPDESKMAQEGQQNAGGAMRSYDNGDVYYDSAPLSEYPRMLYRKTDKEQTQELAESIMGLKDPPMVINRFDGFLCETCIVDTADEAEALAVASWDISPKAAHGVVEGIVAATTAKDDQIAELQRQLAEARAGGEVKRGPGRPPKQIETPIDQTA